MFGKMEHGKSDKFQLHNYKRKMKKIVLFGAGGLGRETAEMIKIINDKEYRYKLLGFIVDEKYYHDGEQVNDIPVIGTTEWLLEHRNDVYCCVAIGDSKNRVPAFLRLKELNVRFETLISPDVYIPDSSSIGNGCIITTRCLISPNVTIEDGVFLNSDVTVGHDTVVHKYATIYSRNQIGGYSEIGTGAQLGSCCCINPHSRIGDGAIVAPMSCVYGKVKANTHVMGNPAHRVNL